MRLLAPPANTIAPDGFSLIKTGISPQRSRIDPAPERPFERYSRLMHRWRGCLASFQAERLSLWLVMPNYSTGIRDGLCRFGNTSASYINSGGLLHVFCHVERSETSQNEILRCAQNDKDFRM